MSEHAGALHVAPSPAIDDCWNRIGVRGDRSCPELALHVHCRNCPVHAVAAVELLRHAPAAADRAAQTAHVAEPKRVEARASESAVIFRLGEERLAFATSLVIEVAHPRPIHSLPHRRRTVVLGVANIRGELLVCASLTAVLGLKGAMAPGADAASGARTRLLVISGEGVRAVCPVDDVLGVHRFHPRDLKDVPATLSKATVKYSKKILPWKGSSVGLLDEHLVFDTLRRALA